MEKNASLSPSKQSPVSRQHPPRSVSGMSLVMMGCRFSSGLSEPSMDQKETQSEFCSFFHVSISLTRWQLCYVGFCTLPPVGQQGGHSDYASFHVSDYSSLCLSWMRDLGRVWCFLQTPADSMQFFTTPMSFSNFSWISPFMLSTEFLTFTSLRPFLKSFMSSALVGLDILVQAATITWHRTARWSLIFKSTVELEDTWRVVKMLSMAPLALSEYWSRSSGPDWIGLAAVFLSMDHLLPTDWCWSPPTKSVRIHRSIYRLDIPTGTGTTPHSDKLRSVGFSFPWIFHGSSRPYVHKCLLLVHQRRYQLPKVFVWEKIIISPPRTFLLLLNVFRTYPSML